jgi:diphthamide synthase (EF-2-diphthine--ammonia ligase)
MRHAIRAICHDFTPDKLNGMFVFIDEIRTWRKYYPSFMLHMVPRHIVQYLSSAMGLKNFLVYTQEF